MPREKCGQKCQVVDVYSVWFLELMTRNFLHYFHIEHNVSSVKYRNNTRSWWFRNPRWQCLHRISFKVILMIHDCRVSVYIDRMAYLVEYARHGIAKCGAKNFPCFFWYLAFLSSTKYETIRGKSLAMCIRQPLCTPHPGHQ